MNRPTWNNFIGKNFDDNRYAMEALARLLFRTRYGLGDSLPYFRNQAGNETEPIVTDNGEIVGFQSKYFENGRIDADQIYDSLKTVSKRYPQQNRYIIYTNGEFGNPKKGKEKTAGQEKIDKFAAENKIEIEWLFKDNVLDLVQENELAYNVFFNPLSHLCHLRQHIDEHNEVELNAISNKINIGNEYYCIDRSSYVNKVAEAIENSSNVLISGESGAGKSAIVKSYCESIVDKSDYALYILNGASFAVNRINDIFSLQEQYTLVDFSSYFDGCSKKIIIIDSAEKILDIENNSISNCSKLIL